MKGAILDKGEEYYTDMKRVFSAIHNIQNEYNWLITDIFVPSDDELFNNPYVWLTGNELTEIINTDNSQWIFAVLSGFPKNIMKEQALEYNLPYADGYRGFWENPVSLQHPLAVVEIVPFDSSFVLIISSDDKIVEDFLISMPCAKDLEDYNNRE